MPERLDKFLASQNLGSRKEVAALIRKGQVTVDGAVVRQADFKLEPEQSTVAAGGREVEYRKHLYIMMNKPAGVLSATEDSRAETVLDLLPPELRRRGLFPAGRLDKNTTGLLIITDDGDFAHQMLAPKSHVYKLYEAKTEQPVTEETVAAFERGVRYGEIQFSPARLWVEERNGEPRAMVEIREGKYHQVKRMFEACGNRVLELKRLKIGGLALDETLYEGEAKLLTNSEISVIFCRQTAPKTGC